MALGINIDGTHHIIPGVFSIVDATDLVDPPSFPTGRIAIVGEATGQLEPGVPHQVVASPSNITSLLQPSDLRTAALMALSPSPELSGTPELWLVPVNPATHASIDIESGGATKLFTLTSAGYGAKYNQTKVKYVTSSARLTIQLDTVVEAYAFTAGPNAIANLVANINTYSNLVVATWVAEGTPKEIAFTDFSGGLDNTGNNTTNQHWQDALGQLVSKDVQLVAVTTAEAAVHAYLATHVNQTNRIGFFGYDDADLSWNIYGNRETNLTELKADKDISVSAAGHPRMMTPGIGGTFGGTHYPSRLIASMYAGAAALVAPTKPLTNIPLNLGALEVVLDDAEVGDLIENGIAVPMRNHGPGGKGYVISHQRLTWVGDENLSRVELSVRRGIDAVQRAVIEELWQFVGEEGVAQVVTRSVFITNKLLARAARGDDFIRIVTFEPRSTRGELIGTILRVYFEYTPILPINFVIAIAKLRRTNLVAQSTDSFDISLSGLGGSLSQQVPV